MKARLTILINEKVKEEAQIEAIKQKTSMSAIIENLLEDYLKKQKAKK